MWFVIEGVCVCVGDNEVIQPKATADTERKRKLDGRCGSMSAYHGGVVAQGYTIPLLGIDVTHPVFAQYFFTNTESTVRPHDRSRTPPSGCGPLFWKLVLLLLFI